MSKEEAHKIVDLENEIKSMQYEYNKLFNYYDKVNTKNNALYQNKNRARYLKFIGYEDKNTSFEFYMPTILKALEQDIENKQIQLNRILEV